MVHLVLHGTPQERTSFVHRVYAGKNSSVRRIDIKRIAKAATHTPNSPVKLLAPHMIHGSETPHVMRQKLHQSVDACFASVGAEDQDHLTLEEFTEVCRASAAWQ